jgi:hypothetical protein
MATEIDQEIECDACEERYPSMRYLDEVETNGEFVWVCRANTTCRDRAVTAVEEDRIARAERGKRLAARAARAERVKREAAKPVVLTEPLETVETLQALVKELRKEAESLRLEVWSEKNAHLILD